MAKLTSLSLDELYAKEKKTRAVELAIIEKEDFSQIVPRYCENVCRLKCKQTDKVFLLGSSELDVLIVQDHQAPAGKFDRRDGQQEQIQRNVLEFVCQKAGFDGLKFRVVNLSKCPSTSNDYPNGKSPTATTLTKCFPYLAAEIERAKPKVIISLGTASTKALGLKKHSNTGNRGEVAISEYGTVVITLHPKIMTYIRQNARGSAGMFGPDYMEIIINDFRKATRLARGEIEYSATTLENAVNRLAADHIFVAKSLDDVKKYMGWVYSLESDRIVSFDTETTSLDPLNPTMRLLTIQFGWRDPKTGELIAVVFPLWHRKNTYYYPDVAWDFITPFLLSEHPKVGHNAKFDILVIYWSKGIRVKNVVFDTLLILHSIYSGAQGTYSLKMAAWDWLLEMGFAGYENDLGDLKKLQKETDKIAAKLVQEAEEFGSETEDLSEFSDEPTEDEQIQFLIEKDD